MKRNHQDAGGNHRGTLASQPLLLAHISDLHISTDHSRHVVRNVRRLLEHILKQGVDHIVVTGDITADARPKEYAAARKLFGTSGLLDPAKLSLIPGNHDIFGGVHTAEEIFSFPKRCKVTDYDAKMQLFQESFHEVFERTVPGDDGRLFPYVKTLSNILLVGINSVDRYSRVKNPIGSNGRVGDRQYARLDALLRADLFKEMRKLVLIHHHLNNSDAEGSGTMHNLWTRIEQQTMKLRGKKRLLELFRSTNVQAVLHGHVHENGEYVRSGVRFLNAGASVLGNASGAPSYRLMRIGESSFETTLQSFEPSCSLQFRSPLAAG